MKGNKAILAFAAAMAVLAFVLRALDYHFMVHDLTMELYLGIVGILFLVFGAWVGNRFWERKTQDTEQVAYAPAEAQPGISAAFSQGELTNREVEILQLMALGHSNQEIADKLFISLNTVKTHSANLFVKLDVKRRTQAILKAKEMNLIG